LTLVGEILAGSLTGRFSSHPNSPTAGHLVNNMTSIAFDPDVFPGHAFFGSDIDHLAAWAKASPPLKSGGSVFLPGEIEDALRAERMARHSRGPRNFCSDQCGGTLSGSDRGIGICCNLIGNDESHFSSSMFGGSVRGCASISWIAAMALSTHCPQCAVKDNKTSPTLLDPSHNSSTENAPSDSASPY
jgi:hypothetical protein